MEKVVGNWPSEKLTGRDRGAFDFCVPRKKKYVEQEEYGQSSKNYSSTINYDSEDQFMLNWLVYYAASARIFEKLIFKEAFFDEHLDDSFTIFTSLDLEFGM